MAPKGYILIILMACLPVILGQSPTSRPAASPTLTAAEAKACKDATNQTECEEMFRNVGGDYLKALTGNLEAMKAHLSQMATSINKTLLNITGDEEFRTCLIDARESYKIITDAVEKDLQTLKTKGLSEWGNRDVSGGGAGFLDVLQCSEYQPDYKFDIFEKDAEAVDKIFSFFSNLYFVLHPDSDY